MSMATQVSCVSAVLGLQAAQACPRSICRSVPTGMEGVVSTCLSGNQLPLFSTAKPQQGELTQCSLHGQSARVSKGSLIRSEDDISPHTCCTGKGNPTICINVPCRLCQMTTSENHQTVTFLSKPRIILILWLLCKCSFSV